MPCLDIGLHRNAHARTRTEAHAHNYTHACIDTLALVYMCTLTHSPTHMHLHTPTHKCPHARVHTCSANTWRQVCTCMGQEVTHDPPGNNLYGFTWLTHKKIKVTAEGVIVCKLRQNVLKVSCRTGAWCFEVWHNVTSLFSLSLLYNDMYNIHGMTDQPLDWKKMMTNHWMWTLSNITNLRKSIRWLFPKTVRFKKRLFRQWKSTGIQIQCCPANSFSSNNVHFEIHLMEKPNKKKIKYCRVSRQAEKWKKSIQPYDVCFIKGSCSHFL